MRELLVGFVSGAAGMLFGGLFMQRIVKLNAEHAVMQDPRVSLDRKAGIIARIRGCPAVWVLDEFNLKRTEAEDE